MVMYVMSAQSPSGPFSVFLLLLADFVDTLKGAHRKVLIITIDSVVSCLHSLQPKLFRDVSYCNWC